MSGQPVDGQTPAIPEVWISLSQLAGLKNVSKQAISKRVKKLVDDGLIETRKDGNEVKVNLVAFDRAIGENTDPAQALRNSRIATPTTLSPAAADAGDSGDDSSPTYAAQRALREGYQAENARLDLEQRVGRTCDKAEVEARTFRVFRRVRDRLLALPAMCATRMFNATDERTARQILDEEVRKALNALSADLDRRDDDEDGEGDFMPTEEESDVTAGDRNTA